MNKEWSLDILYKGYDDPAFLADFNRVATIQAQLSETVNKLPQMPEEEALVAGLKISEEFSELLNGLFNYISLRQSTDTTNPQSMALIGQLQQQYTSSVKDELALRKYIAGVQDLDAVIAKNDYLKQYEFFLKEEKKACEHMLEDNVEEMITKMNLTGGGAWGDLYSYLSSTVEAEYDGKKVTLSDVRNLAHDADPAVRKRAYEAELACYKQIEAPVAFALNNIKKQVNMLSTEKGYASPLAMTLDQSRMTQETLDALWTACKEYLPKFHAYMRRKAELLGYTNGLPWFEMFAPVGKVEKTFTAEEAKDYLVTLFGNFSDDMAEMMRRAFDESWMDFYPRPGKVGGAFCSNITAKKQSRILLNFNGTLSAVDTMAHELGHAYHGQQIEDHLPLNRGYTMPVAETASTFNENVLMSFAIDQAEGEEKLGLIESQLQDVNQTICDIYSRFLFESAVFENCKSQFLFPEQLNELMINAQKEAYGDGLDPEYRHPYMWCCKGHYYSDGLSFYNFPYAFGALFAKGLYAIYKKEGDSFVPKYRELLKATTVCNVEDVAKMVGADITKPDFWRGSLELISETIDEFIRLTNK